MDLMPIAEYLQSKGLGRLGQDLFAYFMPDAVTAGLLLTTQMPVYRNKYAHQLFRGEFQVIARGSTHDEVRARLDSVSDTLDVQGLTLGTMNFRFILPKHAPLAYPRAESRLLEASVNFEFAFTQSS